MKDISYRVALGGIVSALCLVMMFMAGIIPALYIVLPMISGVLLMIIAVEVSIDWAFLVYISVGLLSLIITAEKEAALIFIILFGHYPILRFYIQRIKIILLRFSVKFLIFNMCAVLFYYITVYLFGFEQMMEDMSDFGKYGKLIMLIISNMLFIFYDFDLSASYIVYRKKFMPKLRRKK